MITNKTYILCAILFSVFVVNLNAQITVLEKTRDRMVIDWNITGVDTVSSVTNGKVTTSVSFIEQNCIVADDNLHQLPAYSFFIGIPQTGLPEIALQQVNTTSQNVNNKICTFTTDTQNDENEYNNGWISGPVVSIINGLRVAKVYVIPVKYDSVNNACAVLLHGTITINFPQTTTVNRTSVSEKNKKFFEKLILNYDIAQEWRSKGKLSKRTATSLPLFSQQKIAYFKIGDGHNGLNEGTINENAVYKIAGDKLIALFGSVLISKIALFASAKGPLTATPPVDGNIPDGVYQIPVMRFDINGNGLIDSDDYLLVYASGVSDWVYNKKYTFNVHPYEEYRTYWITVMSDDGLNVQKFIQPAGSGNQYTYFTNRLFCKSSVDTTWENYTLNRWIWKKFTNQSKKFTYSFSMPYLDTMEAGTIKLTGNYSSAAPITISFSGVPIASDTLAIKSWGNRTVDINVNATNDTISYELSSIDFTYKSILNAGYDSLKMTVFSHDDSGVVRYKLSGVNGKKLFLFRMTNCDSSISLIDTIQNTADSTYVWADSGGKGTRYFLCKESSIMSVPEITEYSQTTNYSYCINDIRDVNNTTDYLIVSHPDFVSECVKLAEHKKGNGFSNPHIISTSDIYNEFSGGNKDPAAIRNCIAYIKKYWKNSADLMYVVFVGDGHFDPKKYQSSSTDYVPVYYTESEPKEDYYSYINLTTLANGSLQTDQPDMIMGRFPASSKDDVAAVVNKIIEMESVSVADFSAWRNRVLFVADDDMQGETKDPIPNHYVTSEEIGKILKSKQPATDVRKVYLFEYVKNSSGRKPDAASAILNEIDNGVGHVVYFGHGAEELWADEWVLTNKDVSQMNNQKNYPLVSSYSCSVGFFDRPDKACLSGVLVNAQSAGACATLSSMRESGAGSNNQIAKTFFNEMADSLILSIGNIFLLSKLHSGTSQHGIYSFLGDPSLVINNSRQNIDVKITDINGTVLQKIKALQQIKISGSIKNADLTTDNTFGSSQSTAYVTIGLYNPVDSAARKDGGEDQTIRYELPGTPVFLGKTAVTNGQFEQTVLVSKNVTFGNAGVSLCAYAWKEKNPYTAQGASVGYMFEGTDTSGISASDSVGPAISVRPVYTNSSMNNSELSFTDKITTLLPVNLQICLFDKSGIDVSGTGPDEGLTIEIPGELSIRSLNSTFQFKDGDYREGVGSVEISEQDLSPGTYELNIQSRDLIGNRSLRKITLEITSQDEVKLDKIFNYPNPFRMGESTRFFFYPSNTTDELMSVTAYVRIYSLSGKLLRIFPNASNGVIWDGTDQNGKLLSPNVYLYQVTAYNPEYQKTIKSKISKLVLQPPR